MTPDALEHFEERAAVMEFDGGLPREEAERLAKKKLHEKNLEEVSVSMTLIGNIMLLASNTVKLSGWHVYDGKYLITSSTHEIGSGYTTKIELRRVIDGY